MPPGEYNVDAAGNCWSCNNVYCTGYNSIGGMASPHNTDRCGCCSHLGMTWNAGTLKSRISDMVCNLVLNDLSSIAGRMNDKKHVFCMTQMTACTDRQRER